MDTARRAAAQDRRNVSPTFRCEQCGHDQHRINPEPTKPSRYRLWRLILLRFYRDSTGCKNHYLREDAKGRDFLLAQLVLGLPLDDADQLAPWITVKELRAMTNKAAHIEPTLDNVSRIIKLTSALREKHGWRVDENGQRKRSGILVFAACDETPEATKRRQKAAKNAARRERRQKEQAERQTQCRDPREAAVIAAMHRISSEPFFTLSVPNIIRSIERSSDRAAFPHDHGAFRVTVYRITGRLARRGTLRLSTPPKLARSL